MLPSLLGKLPNIHWYQKDPHQMVMPSCRSAFSPEMSGSARDNDETCCGFSLPSPVLLPLILVLLVADPCVRAHSELSSYNRVVHLSRSPKWLRKYRRPVRFLFLLSRPLASLQDETGEGNSVLHVTLSLLHCLWGTQRWIIFQPRFHCCSCH